MRPLGAWPSSHRKRQKNPWLQQEGRRTHFEISQSIHLPPGELADLGPTTCLTGYQSLTGLGKYSTQAILCHLRGQSVGVKRLRNTCEVQSTGTGSLRDWDLITGLAHPPHHIIKSLFMAVPLYLVHHVWPSRKSCKSYKKTTHFKETKQTLELDLAEMLELLDWLICWRL